jgi:hypothetical protein
LEQRDIVYNIKLCGKSNFKTRKSKKDIRLSALARCFFFSGQGVEAKKWLIETPLERKNIRIKIN